MKLLYDCERNRFFAHIYENAKRLNYGKAIFGSYEQGVGSKALGEILYDAGLVKLGYGLKRDYFVENYKRIFSAMEAAGTFESYLTLIYSVLGSDTEVSFDVVDPAHLKITITPPEGVFDAYAAEDGKPLFSIDDGGDTLAFVSEMTGLTFNETIEIIRSMNNGGIYLEIEVKSE